MPTAHTGRPLRIGLFSLAHVHAETYARILRSRPDVQLLATDPDPHADAPHTRGRSLAQSLGVDYVESYEELLDWRPDGAVLTAENTRRPALLARLAARGVPVLTEKPLATTSADADAVTRLVHRHDLPLMLALPVRYSSDFTRLQQDHRAGVLGDVVSVQAVNTARLPDRRRWFTDPALSGGGAFVDHLVHVLDLVDRLTGDTPVHVSAVGNRVLHPGAGAVETAGLATIGYRSGTIVSIDCSWSVPETAPTWGGLELRIAGTRGAVEVDFFRPRLRGTSRRSGLPLELPYGTDLDERMLDAFLRRLRGQEEHTTDQDLTSAARLVQVVEAAQESARTGRTVAVSATPDRVPA
ncbi:Gfo/Idh/MocA family protein [Kineococcus aurantiacus]|uniref:Putative dehydrogenase n=1 Tax=Kineococcus aurantiacus TaxID=37633 RepID=A0A7Y9DQC5_9ACTN|nr:Gfo/Idh/MocA family oxidoreductase [Kineococcus aurantiacus]NYD24813.1 putative dehydrogenase [Kineococcus aurantiacus]